MNAHADTRPAAETVSVLPVIGGLGVAAKAVGSCFLVAASLAVTCVHVVKEHRGGNLLFVEVPGGRRVRVARCLPAPDEDEWNRDLGAADLAILELAERIPLPPLPLAVGARPEAAFGGAFWRTAPSAWSLRSLGYPANRDGRRLATYNFSSAQESIKYGGDGGTANFTIDNFIREGMSGGPAVVGPPGAAVVVGMNVMGGGNTSFSRYTTAEVILEALWRRRYMPAVAPWPGGALDRDGVLALRRRLCGLAGVPEKPVPIDVRCGGKGQRVDVIAVPPLTAGPSLNAGPSLDAGGLGRPSAHVFIGLRGMHERNVTAADVMTFLRRLEVSGVAGCCRLPSVGELLGAWTACGTHPLPGPFSVGRASHPWSVELCPNGGGELATAEPGQGPLYRIDPQGRAHCLSGPRAALSSIRYRIAIDIAPRPDAGHGTV